MVPRSLAVLVVGVLCLAGCGRPTAAEMRDKLGKMPTGTCRAPSREELIEIIGLEPDEIESDRLDSECESWIYHLSGGDVRLMVCHLDGMYIGQVRQFGTPEKQ